MRGLRTQENSSFLKFFELVQAKAKANGSIFFLQAGDGRDIFKDELEGEDLTGWLIPNSLSDEFEKEFLEQREDKTGKWEEFFAFSVWEEQEDKLNIKFEFYDENGQLVKEIK